MAQRFLDIVLSALALIVLSPFAILAKMPLTMSASEMPSWGTILAEGTSGRLSSRS